MRRQCLRRRYEASIRGHWPATEQNSLWKEGDERQGVSGTPGANEATGALVHRYASRAGQPDRTFSAPDYYTWIEMVMM